MVRLLIPALLLISAAATAQHAAPLQREQIAALVDARNFAELESIADRARRTKEYTRDGYWVLQDFYMYAVGRTTDIARESETRFRETMAAWIQAYPKSPTPRIVMAESLVDLAWDRRGDGWAVDVTPEGWDGFFKYLNEAWTVLQDARKISTSDPHMYAVFTSAALGLGQVPESDDSRPFTTLKQRVLGAFGLGPEDRSLADAIFDEAVSKEENYIDFYARQMQHHQERWGGAPGDEERFALRVRDVGGDDMYAQLAWSSLKMLGEEQFIPVNTFQWKSIQNGFEERLKAFPNSNVIKNQYARMACAFQDRETARAMLASTEPMPAQYWQSLNRFQYWKRWIDGEIPYPGFTRLEEAILTEREDYVDQLIAGGEKVNVTLFMGRSPLMMAVIRGNTDIAASLLKAGANPHALTAKGNTPLNEAARLQTTDMIAVLIEGGADPGFVDGTGWCTLHQTAREGRADMAAALIDAGANVNQTIGGNWTPLHVAAEFNKGDVAAVLLEHGADKAAKTDDGQTPLDVAKKKGSGTVIQAINKAR